MNSQLFETWLVESIKNSINIHIIYTDEFQFEDMSG